MELTFNKKGSNWNEPFFTSKKITVFMTRQEAKLALVRGATIRHQTFLPGEYISVLDGKLKDEQLNTLDPVDFWSLRKGGVFENGWEVIEK